METDTIKKFIQKIPFFKEFNDHELNKLVGKERIFKDYKEGDIIFDEGDPGSSLYLLVFGKVELVKSYEKGPDAVIMEVKAGWVFGEIAMLTNRKRNLAARAASTKVVIMEFQATYIEKLIPSIQTKFQKQLLAVLATNLDTMNMRYAELSSSIEIREELADGGEIS